MPHPTDVHVGHRLREVRIMRGLTQTQLGERLGISFQQVQKYEKGTNRIGSSRIWDMCGILDVPVSFFFEGLGDDKSDDEKISRRALQLAKELDRIADDDVKTNFLQLLKVYNTN
jgi:transcriptional regulator with XRE-family HTH domain